MKKEITILYRWDKEAPYEIDGSVEDYVKMESEVKASGENGFRNSKYRTKIMFSSVYNPTGKTQYLTIEAPTQTREPTQAEKDKAAKILRNLLKKAEINKEENFIKKRNETLERLRLEEVKLGLQTTIDKIEQYNRLKLK